MNLKTMLFGGYTPPDVPGRLIAPDGELLPEHMRTFCKQAASNYAKHRKVSEKNLNTERIKNHLIQHPWCTAQDVGNALGLSKSPVYKNLLQFKENGKVDIRTKHIGPYKIISYKWRDEV